MINVVIVSANLLHANVFENPETSREINNTFQNEEINDDCKTINQLFKNTLKPSSKKLESLMLEKLRHQGTRFFHW